VSKGNPFHSRVKGEVGDVGGDFFTQRSYVEAIPDRYSNSSKLDGNYYRDRQYFGPILAIAPSLASFPPALNSSEDDLDELGATAIARCKPTNSVADASTFLGELLKEGLPRAVGARTWEDRTRGLTGKTAGNEFLNTQFGWLPLVDEVQKFMEIITHGRAVLAQYERDAGKVVRRRYNFPVNKETSETWLGAKEAFTPLTDSSMLGGTFGNLVKVREKTQRQWFSGAFTYHLPSGYDSRIAMDRLALSARKLLGLQLTPEVLWNLAPWSWAADWVSNTGDVLSNISSFTQDGLFLRYGYMMEHTIVKDTYILSKSRFNDGAKPNNLVLVTETKMRRRANPFGFGVSWDGLSAIQAAILTAIGVTRK